MKVKITNQVEARRSHKRKEIGQVVTRLLKNLKEASAENVVGLASRHLNRSSAQIFPAVKRTLNYGVRNGFIIKRGNKFSLSSKQNYETDNDKYDGRYKNYPIVQIRDVLKGASSSFVETCKKGTKKICETTPTDKQCVAMDLITFVQCNYKISSQHSELCEHHQRLRVIFHYKKVFFTNLESILPLYDQVGIDPKIRKRINSLQLYHERANVIDSYVQFLEKYSRFIFQEHDDTQNGDLIKRVLLCANKLEDANKSGCVGVNLEDGFRCSERRQKIGRKRSPHCQVHQTLHTFHKLFTHPYLAGDGLHSNMVEAVFNIQNRLNDTFSDEEKELLLDLPNCLRTYVEVVTRLEDRAINQVIDEIIYKHCYTNVSTYRSHLPGFFIFLFENIYF